jgi:hypothetical protein
MPPSLCPCSPEKLRFHIQQSQKYERAKENMLGTAKVPENIAYWSNKGEECLMHQSTILMRNK